jgi:hypothetical protein
MSGSYRHFIEPGRKETRGSDIYSLARRLLANGTIQLIPSDSLNDISPE